MKKELSIIIPTRNEESNISELISRLATAMVNHDFLYEILVVDDKSTDKTQEIVNSLALFFPVKFFLKKGKQGKAYSLVEGFSNSKYRNLAFIDADLQYPPDEMPKMAKKLEKYDVIVAERKKYNSSFVRKFLSRNFKFWFGKIIFGLDFDIQSGMKVFKKNVIKVTNVKPKSPWTFDLEFLYKASNAGYRLGKYKINFGKRTGGNSSVEALKTSVEIGINALFLRLKSAKPMQFSKSDNSMRGAGIRFKKKKFVTHSTLSYSKTSITTFSFFQKVFIIFSAIFLFFGLLTNHILTLGIVVALLSIIYFADTLFNTIIAVNSVRKPQEIKFNRQEKFNSSNLPIYTILCPLYKEAEIIEQFVENIKKLSWPKDKLDVILLLEKDDLASIYEANNLQLPDYVRVIVVPKSNPKTKPKACNYGLSYALGEYLVIYDAEDKPERYQLKKAYQAFKNSDNDIVCLQAKLNYYNPSQNLLTRLFTTEYSLWFDVTLTGLQSINTSIPLGGTSNHFRVKDLKKLKGWDPFNVTEDADLGMRLFKEGYKTAIINSTTYEEANSDLKNWMRQRSRWIKGYMQTYLVHSRNPISFAKNHGIHFLIFHLIVGGKIAFIFINPILWITTISYFTLNQFVGSAIESLYPAAIFYIAIFSFIFGNFLFMYNYMVGVMKREQYHLIKYVFLVPFYWLMISIAGVIALYQLVVKPFYWEKTNHGLNLGNENKKFIIPKISIEPVRYLV